MLELHIGNKNYSSWSMRPWVLLKHFGIPFREVRHRFDSFAPGSSFKQGVGRLSPVGKVPVLVHGDLVVWDTLGVTHSAKQMLAIVAGGVAGAFALVGGLLLLHRRLMDPRVRANSSFADTAILVMLMAQLLLGLATIPISLTHRDGHEMMKFMNWAQGVFTLRPGIADLVADVHWIFKAHLTLGLTILLVFPFTRLVHMLSAPIWYLNRRGWQLVRTRRDMSVRKGPVRLDPAE